MKELENKLQFVITIALFFPVLMFALLEKKIADQATLKWGILIIFLILDYLYIDLLKTELSNKLKKWIALILDLNILLFVPLIFSFAIPINSVIVTKSLVLVGLWGVTLMPIALAFLLIGSTIAKSISKFILK